jgi:halimadienyl-diphosphate synthase
MTIYPTEVFEYGWMLYNLMLAGLYFDKYAEICRFLQRNVGRCGIGWSTESFIPDADDTAVVVKTLHTMQYPVDFSVFEPYDAGDYYLTFQFELDPSVSTNIHVLDCARSCPEFPDRDDVIETLLCFLRKTMHTTGFWQDKWHTSPYYCTGHAVTTLCDTDPSLAEHAVSWILDTQHETGLWGQNNGTLEETMYAVQALIYYHTHVEHIDMQCVYSALSNCTYTADNQAELWAGKVLYASVPVFFSSALSAQYMARTQTLAVIPSVWR